MAQTKAQLIDGKGAVDLGALSISGSAPDNSVNLDASGRLLVGTSSTDSFYNSGVQIAGAGGSNAASQLISRFSADAASAVLYFQKSRGASVGTNTIVNNGDDLGLIGFYGANGSNANEAARITAQVDGAPGASNDMPGRLVFSTTADGASSPTERMRISNAGGVFIGNTTGAVTGNPTDGLHVGASGSFLGGGYLTLGDGLATARWRITTGNSRLNFAQNDGAGNYNIRAYVNDTTGAYVQVSDQRAKKEIADSTYGIADLKKLRPVSYLMNSQDEDSARRNLGFIAQEVLEVIPEAVNKPEDEQQMYGLESIALIPVLVSSLQQAVAKIEQLEAKVAALESA